MKNGQLKAGYNIQVSTENQIITHYTIQQTSTDTTTLQSHLDTFEQAYGKQSAEIIADAGYGSQENYQMLTDREIRHFIPYNMYRLEQTKKYTANPFLPKNLYYDAIEDFFVCPMGQRMDRIFIKKSETSTGFVQYTRVYQAINCNGCPMRGQCHKASGNRRIEVNHGMKQVRVKAKENLESERGKELYPQRCVEPEPVFGNIKQNKGFKRFTLRKTHKVAVEFGLVAIAHNFSK